MGSTAPLLSTGPVLVDTLYYLTIFMFLPWLLEKGGNSKSGQLKLVKLKT